MELYLDCPIHLYGAVLRHRDIFTLPSVKTRLEQAQTYFKRN